MASAPARPANCVELAMSQNSTVTCLRSPSRVDRAGEDLLGQMSWRIALGEDLCRSPGTWLGLS